MAAEGQRYAGPGRVHLRGPRQCLRVDVFPDVGQSAVPDRDGEDPVVLERLVRGFDLSPREADDEDPVSLRHELPGFRGRFYRLGCRLKQIRQPRVSAARSGQRPVLARNDPLDVFGDQRQRASLSPRPIAAKKSFTVWMFFSMLMRISPFRTDRICARSDP